MRATVALAAAVIAVAVLCWGMGSETLRPPANPDSAAEPTPPAAQAAPAPASATVTTRPAPIATSAADRVDLPDGTSVAPLNGATGALALASAWGARPWSPIVGVERSDIGVDWYVHADGTRSTTEMKWRPDLGRSDAMVRVAVPQADTPAVQAR